MGGFFRTFGPFELQRDKGAVDEIAVRSLFLADGNVPKGLDEAIGVYILALQTKNMVPIPWYVGQTRKGFLKRFVSHSRLKKSFGDIGKIPEAGQLIVFMMALASEKTGKFQKPSTTPAKIRAVDLLEERLIGTCLSLNNDLLNTSNKTLNEALRVPGYIDHKATKRDASASALAEMLKVE